jgi:dihydropyrimidine dehydrogenase (NAD+) subunit PreA
MADLKITYAGVEFKNPLVAVAGPLGRTFESLKRSIEAGAGAVTLKSANTKPEKYEGLPPISHLFTRPAHVMLNKFGLPKSMINWEGVPVDFLAEDQKEMILRIRPIADKHGTKIIANIHPDPAYAADLDKFRKDVKILLSAEPDLFETCPCPYHIEDMIDMTGEAGKLGDDLLNPLYAIIAEEAGKVGIPVIAKLNWPIFEQVRPVLKKLGIMNVHITEGPHFYGTIVDIESMKPLCPGPSVITYGSHRRPVMNLQVAKTKAHDEGFDVMSSSGVWTTYDVIERMMCGAQLVGMHTAIQSKGHGLFTKLIDGVSEFLDRKSLSYDKVVAAAVPQIVSEAAHESFMRERALPEEEIWPEVDTDKCNGCGMCAVCIHGGIAMENEIATTKLDLCVRCGVCESLCPKDAIKMVLAQAA